MTFADSLRDRLRGRLPGPEAQMLMSPRGRPRLKDLDRECREAGVLALLHPVEGGPGVVLIERPGHLNKHAGQVAFPGGRREEGESRLEAAIRETWEEVGVSADRFEILGSLTPLFVPPSGFCVYPFVAWADSLPPFVTDPNEVAGAFSVPLAEFVDGPRSLINHPRLQRPVPAYEVGGHIVWGATAMMLSELAVVVEPLLPRSPEVQTPN